MQLPGSTYRLADATVAACLVDGAALGGDRDGLVRVDIDVADGRIAAVAPATGRPGTRPPIPLVGRMVWPCFVDLHTHLDKGHIWERAPNPDATHHGAVGTVAADRGTRWTAPDVSRRMDFSLRSAWAHGTTAIRTHLDSQAPQRRISWPVFAAMREAWAGRITLQAASIAPLELFSDRRDADDLAGVVADHGGLLGGVVLAPGDLTELLDRVFLAAKAHRLDIDLHVDETTDARATGLRQVAEATLRHGYEGRVVCGHVCAIAYQDHRQAAETIALVARAGIGIVSLPMCNIYLQGRAPATTPRQRGITLLHEFRAAGVPVAIASDNTRDPFYAFGDLDMLEVLREGVRIGQLDRPYGDWPTAFTRVPADLMRLPQAGRLAVGAPADLVILRGRRYSEILARPESDRTVLRAGRVIDTTLPDYAELDDLIQP
jgi:cytosine deaminase